MPGIIDKLKDKLSSDTENGGKSDSRSPARNGSPMTKVLRTGGSKKRTDSENGIEKDRVIPPEPVQQSPEGDFSESESGPVLQVLNLSRASKMVGALEWDSQLAKDAESYAQRMASSGIIEHSGIKAQGENLYMRAGQATFETAAQKWLDGEKEYNGEEAGGDNYDKWKSFSQCLWASTTHVGMGKAESNDGSTYIVARFSPAGNVEGQKPFEKSVPPSTSSNSS